MHKPGFIPYDLVTIATSATAEQLSSASVNNNVTVIASLSNGVSIFVGFDNTVTNTKYYIELQAGDSVELLVDNADQVWVYATFTAETHNFSYAIF
ncbi:MAG: hypothetical protein H8D67_18920 [Deltaproteobacteria bacterium]|nr:hypothetical protein [Deltaproteobacteria bacterium]